MTTEELFIQEYKKMDKEYRKALKKKNIRHFRKSLPSGELDLPVEMIYSLHDTYLSFLNILANEINGDVK